MPVPPGLWPTDPPAVAHQQWSGITGRAGLDIGAHHGENFPFLKAAGCETIVAFEPDPALHAGIKANWPEVACLPYAVSSANKKVRFGHANGMLTSLPGAAPDHTWRPYEAVTLDWFCHHYLTPDVVVVDVEGHEQDVLDGAQIMTPQVKPSWLIEFHTLALHESVSRTLLGWGYKVDTIRHPDYPPCSDLWYGHGWVKALR